MQQAFDQLRRAISPERLNSYRHTPADAEIDLLASYFWNIALCEALYPPLHWLEVSLRNRIDAAATQAFGHWLDPASPVLLPEEQAKVASVVNDLLRQSKPTNVGRIVAGLEFSFWTSLFRSAYDQRLWPHLLAPVFPHMPPRNRTRGYLSNRLTQLRRFRNRVFHHEPIWRMNLDQQHADLLETIGWMSPMVRDLVAAGDRFARLYQSGQGFAVYKTQLEGFLNSLPP